MAAERGCCSKKEDNHEEIVKHSALCGTAAIASGCSSGAGELTADSKSATDITAEANAAVYDLLDFDDDQEMEFAEKG